jgi:EAL domain-containing protein (putative c-di-GMP-specific phosphodiesterase class I)
VTEHSALNTILQPGGITPLYQPIVEVSNGHTQIRGVECLSRGPKGTNFESAKVLFDYVRLKREESLVDRACITAALEASGALPESLGLALNVHASTLGRDTSFVAFLRTTAERHHVAMSRLTVEIVEHAPPWDGASFLSAIAAIRAAGAKVAVDDVGLGQSNFKMLLDVEPDYLKLDRYFVDACTNDPKRQAVISAVSQLARDFGAEVIAEGVEDLESLATLQRLGVSLMQGFYFARPMRAGDVRLD